jgi:hypothetical protein
LRSPIAFRENGETWLGAKMRWSRFSWSSSGFVVRSDGNQRDPDRIKCNQCADLGRVDFATARPNRGHRGFTVDHKQLKYIGETCLEWWASDRLPDKFSGPNASNHTVLVLVADVLTNVWFAVRIAWQIS